MEDQYGITKNILDRFEQLSEDQDLELSVDENNVGADFAFSTDVLTIIYTCFITTFVAEVAKETFKRLTSGKSPSPDNIIKEVGDKTQSVEEALNRLTKQGYKTKDARAALHLLREAVRQELV